MNTIVTFSILRLRAAIAVSLCILAGARLHAAVPAAAQEPFQKGMSAVQQQDFPLAIRYFNEARAAAPDAPDLLFNLALAEAQVPGRELRAVCWFEAYLALAPASANAGAVRKQIGDLEVRTEGNVRKIVDVMKVLAGKFPSGDSSVTTAVSRIACTLAKSGDMEATVTVIESQPSDDRDSTRKDVVDVLSRNGKFDEARKMAGSISYDANYKTSRSDAYTSIADTLADCGLYADARQAAGYISTPFPHMRVLGKLVQGLYQSGSQEDAMAVMAEMKQIAEKPKKEQAQYLLQYLAVAQAGIGQQQEAKATLKRLDALLPSKTSPNNNYSIHDALLAHLEAFDIPGAKALAQRLVDVPGFKYKTQSLISINEAVMKNIVKQFATIQKPYAASDMAGMETSLAGGRLFPLARVWGYAGLAKLYKQSQPGKAPEIFEKAQAAFPSVGEAPLDKSVAAIWIARIADLAGMPAEADKWRLKALQSLDALVKSGTPGIPYDLASLYGSYKYSGVVQEIITEALASHDDKTFKAGVAGVKKFLSKAAPDVQTSMAGTVLWHFWWVDKDFNAAADFIKTIPDPKLRQQALDKHHDILFSKSIDTENFPEAAKHLGMISDDPAGSTPLQKSEKTANQRELSRAYADAGDWANAEKIAAAVSDPKARKSFMDYIASSHAAGEYNAQSQDEYLTKWWRGKRAEFDSLTQPAERLSAYWSLCASSVWSEVDGRRKLMPDYFAAAMANPKPADRVNPLGNVITAAQRLGMLEMERHARAAAFSAMRASPAFDSYSVTSVFSQSGLGDYYEQASLRWPDDILVLAVGRLIADGNPAAAEKILPKLGIDESVRNQLLMNIRIAQGDLAGARTAYDAIRKDKPGLSAKTYATRDLAHACIAAGDVASAKSVYTESKKLRDNDSVGSSVLVEIAQAGEPEWAKQEAKSISYPPNRFEAEAAACGTLAARANDAGIVRPLLKEMLENGNSYYQYKVIDALIAAGNPQLAVALLPDLSNADSRASAMHSIAVALVRAGDMAAAKSVADTIPNNTKRFNTRCSMAGAQAERGDMDGARATLIEARKRDTRTSPGIDMEGWIGEQLYSALLRKKDIADALAFAMKIQDPARRDTLLGRLAVYAGATKNSEGARTTFAAITDPAVKARAAGDLYGYATDPAAILAYADQMNDPGLQSVALEVAVNKSIALGNVSAVLPRVLALPDGEVKAYLLCDIIRAQVFPGLDAGNTSLLPLAVKALAAMPPGAWHALLLSDLARLARETSPSQAELLATRAATEAQDLTGDEAKTRQQFLADADLAKTGMQKPVSSSGSGDSPAKPWISYVEYDLKGPLFTDFKSALDGAASSSESSSGNKAWAVFSNVNQLADNLIDKLSEISELRVKQSKAAAK